MVRFKPTQTGVAATTSAASKSVPISQLPVDGSSSDVEDGDSAVPPAAVAAAPAPPPPPPPQPSSSRGGIQAISRSDVHRITSGQVILVSS